jgi:hypothetical protein
MPLPRLDIPTAAPHAATTMVDTHVRVSLTPNDEQQLAYDLLVPKTWAYSKQFGPTATGLLQTRGLGFFASGSEPDGPVVATTVSVIPFEVPIDTWARLGFAQDGWEIIAGHWFPGPYGLFYDLTGARENTAGGWQVRRSSVRVRGTQLFSLNCMCNAAHWDELKESFWVAHLSFELSMKGSTRMEPWLAGIAERPDFQFGYPASWTSEAKQPQADGTSAVDVRLLNARGDTLLAYLQVAAYQRKEGEAAPILSLHERESRTLLEKAGLTIYVPPRRLTGDEDPRAEAVAGWLGAFAGEGVMAGGRVYARTGFLDRSGATFTFILISPLPADDALTALRAQRAFEIARASLVTPG